MNRDIEAQSRREFMGTTTSAVIERTTVATGLTYEALVESFERELGHWDPAVGKSLLARNAAWSEVESEVAKMARGHGMMIISRIHQGALAPLSGMTERSSLYLVGNPVIATRILRIDPRGRFYVPMRVCLYDDGGSGGSCLTYDRPSSFLAALGRPELVEIGVLIDSRIDEFVHALAEPNFRPSNRSLL